MGILIPNSHHRADVDLKWIPRAYLFLQLTLILEGQVSNVDFVLKCKRELAVCKNSIFR